MGKIDYHRVHIIGSAWGMHRIRGSHLGGEEVKTRDSSTELTEGSPRTLAWVEENQAGAGGKSGFEPKEIPEEFALRAEDAR